MRSTSNPARQRTELVIDGDPERLKDARSGMSSARSRDDRSDGGGKVKRRADRALFPQSGDASSNMHGARFFPIFAKNARQLGGSGRVDDVGRGARIFLRLIRMSKGPSFIMANPRFAVSSW